jgi:DNA-binding NarL/FixJ family response regulator
MQERAHLLGGECVVESAPGAGTIVRVVLPYDEPQTEPAPAQNGHITVVIADDHGIFRRGLRALLERENVRVVGEAATGRDAIRLAESLSPQVLLLDIRMPDLDGLQALARIKAVRPETSVIMLTGQGTPGYFARAIVEGAAGFLTKESEPERILAGVRAAATGEHLLDPEVLRVALAEVTALNPPDLQAEPVPPELLTHAERRVLRLLADGLDTEAMATALGISVNTVKTHIGHILQKLQVSDRTQAALWAARHGFR